MNEALGLLIKLYCYICFTVGIFIVSQKIIYAIFLKINEPYRKYRAKKFRETL